MRMLYLSESESCSAPGEGEGGDSLHPQPAAVGSSCRPPAMTCHLQSGMAIDPHALEAAEMTASLSLTWD
eukprot:4591086-Pyramimonas_sp.AAC.1